MPELELIGCRTKPLLGYLKALGVLRAVAEQADADARGSWRGSHFVLISSLSNKDLVEWLSQQYCPPTVLNPWNGGGGFYANNPSAPALLARIERSSNRRLDAYRQAIGVARKTLSDLDLSTQPTERAKVGLVYALRSRWSDAAIEWLDAAVVIGPKTVAKLPILLTGGNDGNFDFSFNFMQALEAVIGLDDDPPASSRELAKEALLDVAVPVGNTNTAHFDRDRSPVIGRVPTPSAAPARGNPWDLVLAIEGSLLLTAGMARRQGSGPSSGLVAPFAARSTAAGHGSAIAVRSSAAAARKLGGEVGGDEVWLPIWRSPALLSEVESIAREARAQVGRRSARTGLDFVRASAEMGVARGIESFQRYAMLERAGQATLAVPAGRVLVKSRPAVQALSGIDRWLERLTRAARGDLPGSLKQGINSLERVVFEFANHGGPLSAANVIISIGELESSLARSSSAAERAQLRPPSGITAAPWINAIDDQRPETAAAVALASVRDGFPGSKSLPQLRDYLHGTVNGSDGRTYPGTDVSRMNRSATWDARLTEVQIRRHLDAEGHQVKGPDASGTGLVRHWGFPRGAPAPLSAARGLANGTVDGDLTLALAAGLCVLDFDTEPMHNPGCHKTLSTSPLFDLLALAWHGTKAIPLSPMPGWAAKLAAGRWNDVAAEAHLRLRLAGLVPLLDASDLTTDWQEGPQLGAALLLPLGTRQREWLAASWTQQAEDDESNPNQEESDA